jgi:hypothetical protein
MTGHLRGQARQTVCLHGMYQSSHAADDVMLSPIDEVVQEHATSPV